MTALQTPAPTIDYVKYLIPMDHDRLQDFMRTFNARESADELRGLRYGRNLKFSLLDSTASERRKRVVLESWGPNSRELIEVMDPDYMDKIVRLDFRLELQHVDTRDVEAYAARVQLGKKGRRNIQSFNSRPRQKTATRDIGGFCLFIGSRKSDSHTTAYARGDEPPAVEHRFQGNKALDIASRAQVKFNDSEHRYAPSSFVMEELVTAARVELTASTGYTSWGDLCAAMRDARSWYDKLQAASEWLETEEEAAFWSGLSEEEQAAMQDTTYVPTDVLGVKEVKIKKLTPEEIASAFAEGAASPANATDPTGREWTDGEGRIVHVCGPVCNPFVPFGEEGH